MIAKLLRGLTVILAEANSDSNALLYVTSTPPAELRTETTTAVADRARQRRCSAYAVVAAMTILFW